MLANATTPRKVLILSYHALPMEVIASYRAQGYLQHFYTSGLAPTLLTHRWERNPNGAWKHHKRNAKSTTHNHKTHQIIRLPRIRRTRTKVLKLIYQTRLLKYFYILFSWLYGHLDLLPEQWDSYWTYKGFLKRHLRTHSYDLILAIYSPHHHLRLAYEMHKIFHIPYVLDLRDLWDTRVMQINYTPSPRERLHDTCCKHYWNKWLSNARFFSITSDEWKAKVSEITTTTGKTILNGYEEDFFRTSGVRDHSRFTIVHAGTLYRHQHLHIFIEGVHQFLMKHSPDKFKVLLIGAQKYISYRTRTSPMSDEMLVRMIQPIHPCTELLPRTCKARAVECIREAQILLLPSFPRHPGTYSTKIFDYLAAQKPILAVPEDGGVIDRIMKQTGAGHIANTPEDVCEFIAKRYTEWKANSPSAPKPLPPSVSQYRRQYQVQQMAQHIHESLERLTAHAHSSSRTLVSVS